MTLRDCRALITGGSSGIGFAIAKAFAENGASVWLVARGEERLEQARQQLDMGKTEIRITSADLTEPYDISQLAEEVTAEWGSLDVLVNNAGGNTDFERPAPEEYDLSVLAANWQANIDSNLMSAVLLTAALDNRIAKNGRIITIGSIAARQGAGSYGAAKAAVEAWNQDIAAKFGEQNVTANVISPGLILETGFFKGNLTEEKTENLVSETHNGRAGRPDDIAATALFLASAASGHVTGQVIHVNGGAYAGL